MVKFFTAPKEYDWTIMAVMVAIAILVIVLKKITKI